MDENRLIKEAQQGNLEAFNRLVLAYQDMAYNLAYRILSDEEAAEDATQNSFIAAYRNINNFRGGIFRAWLLRMVTNNCYDELRRRKRRPTISLEPLNQENDEEIDSPAWLADDRPSPEQLLEQVDLSKAIQHCLNGLPEEFRAIVVMVEVEQMDYQEASQACGSPLGTVKSRLARARVKMKDCLQQFWELLPDKFRQEIENTL
jgi:RNA polymerase sigma-70 factor, ECF subfamily